MRFSPSPHFMNKLFIVQKYVVASSAEEAIKKEKNQKADEVWLDQDWKKGAINKADSAFGVIKDNVKG